MGSFFDLNILSKDLNWFTNQDINNLLNTDYNMDYIHKIKIIIDGVCKDIINCNID